MMNTPVMELRGVGKGIARALAENGIETIGDLAAASVDKLTGIRGFGVARAKSLVMAAKAALKGAGSAAPGAGGDDNADEKKKKKKKKKKKNKKNKKKKNE